MRLPLYFADYGEYVPLFYCGFAFFLETVEVGSRLWAKYL